MQGKKQLMCIFTYIEQVIRKFVITAILLVSASLTIKAQMRTDYVIGLNLSNMEVKSPGVSITSAARVGIHFGQLFDIPLNDNFALQPGILLSTKGSNYRIDTARYSIAPVYLEVPVDFVVTMGSEKLKCYFLGGGYAAYGVGGYMVDPAGNFTFLNLRSGEMHEIRPFDAGLVVGTGLNIKGFIVSVQYKYGLSNLSVSSASGGVMRNRVIALSASAIFSGK